MNKAIIMGRLGKDPELRYAPAGDAVANFSVATDNKYKDKSTGEMVSKPDWHNVVAWCRTAEIAGEYLRKGSQVLIEGKMQTRKWQDKEGRDRWSTEVVCDRLTLLGSRQGSSGTPSQPAAKPPEDFDDEIPF